MFTLLSDPPEQEIARILTPEFFARSRRRVEHDLDYQLARNVPRSFPSVTSEVPPQDAALVLRECAKYVETHITALAAGYSSLRWLWMLRRLPAHVFAGELSTTFGYDSTLAAVISGRSTLATSGLRLLDEEICTYPIAGAAIRRLADFCAGVRYLSNLHAYLRWAGKGASFRFSRTGRPVPIPDAELRRAVELYDSRVVASALPFERGGTILGLATLEATERTSILRVDYLAQPEFVPLPERFIPEPLSAKLSGLSAKAYCRFIPTEISLEPLARFLQTTKGVTPWPREVLTLIVLLWGTAFFVSQHRAGFISLLTRGYLMLGPRLVEDLLDLVIDEVPEVLSWLFSSDYSPPTSGASFLEELRSISGRVWPLRAGPILRCEDMIRCLDLQAATNCLDAILEIESKDGPTANTRAGHFELATQELINRSAWKPNPTLAELRGRPLRHSGKVVTDIDAIGEHEGQLLLVSCKSLIYSGDYDVGDYGTVRNAATIVSNAVQDWNRKVSLLRSLAAGDNFDFSKFTDFIPVVCTPTAIYVPMGPAIEEIRPGLRAANSLVELARWLGIPYRWPWVKD